MSRLRRQIASLDAAKRGLYGGASDASAPEEWHYEVQFDDKEDIAKQFEQEARNRGFLTIRSFGLVTTTMSAKEGVRLAKALLMGKGLQYGQLVVDWSDMKRVLKRARETERMDGTWRKGALFGESVRMLEPAPHSSRVPDFRSLSADGRKNFHRLADDARKFLGDDVDIIQNEEDIEAAVTTRWPETDEE